MSFQKVTDELFVADLKASGGVAIQLTGRRDVSFGNGHVYYNADMADHVLWGVGDNMPNSMRKLIERNSIVFPLLQSSRDMIYGSGVGFFKKNIVDNKLELVPFTDTKLEEWCEDVNLPSLIIERINQRVDNANIFTRWIWDLKSKWFRLETSDSFTTRIGKPEAKKPVTEFHSNPYFGETLRQTLGESDKISAFAERNMDENRLNTVTIRHTREGIPGQPFYAFPSWWCGQDAVELANLIIEFHKNGIFNGYNIKYLIRMPKDHFKEGNGKSLSENEQQVKWKSFEENFSKWLGGQKNVNKSLIVKYLRGSDGKMLDNVDVQPLKNEMSDEAYEKVWEIANRSIANSIGLLPTLAGVNPGKGNDSGSQIRVMAEFQQHFRTPIHRHFVLEDVRLALRSLGYTDVIPKFQDVQITTLDANPTGSQAVINHS